MAESERKIVRLPPKLAQAIRQYLKKRKTTFSDETRKFWANKVGKPELAKGVRRGRPKEDEAEDR